MKKQFEEVLIEVITLDSQDVICTSGATNEIPDFGNGGSFEVK